MKNTTFNEYSMSERRVYEWYKRFREIRENAKDYECPKPTRKSPKKTWNIVEETIMNDRLIKIRDAIRKKTRYVTFSSR